MVAIRKYRPLELEEDSVESALAGVSAAQHAPVGVGVLSVVMA